MDRRALIPKAKREARKWLRRVMRTFPPGTRGLVGLLLITGGFLAILPVFGLWMLPVGAAILWLDVRAWRRWRAGRRVRWFRGVRKHVPRKSGE